jgi:hypothetical protein
VLTVAGAAVLGGLATAIIGREPGPLLGSLVLVATLLAGTAVRPGAAYLIVPMPALCYLVAAITDGLYHDRAADTSLTALAASALQWAASGFWLMTVATGAAIVIAAARWFAHRHDRRDGEAGADGYGEDYSQRPRRGHRGGTGYPEA